MRPILPETHRERRAAERLSATARTDSRPVGARRLCIETAWKSGDAGRRGGVRGRGGWTSFRLVAQRLLNLRKCRGAGDPAEPHPDLSAGLRAGGVVAFDRPAGSLGARGSESPPSDQCGAKPLRGGMRRTLDSAPHPPAPPGLAGCAVGTVPHSGQRSGVARRS